jgi:hypothetical protein
MSLKPESASPPDAPAPRASQPLPWAALAMLAAAALAIELVLFWLTRLMSLPEFFPGPQRISLDFVKMLGPDWVHNTWLQVAAFAILFVAFGIALLLLRGVRETRSTLAMVFLPPALWSITASFMYPPYAVDLFHNLADSRLLWIYRLNPMLVAPIARPFAIGTSYGDQPSAYGPLWFLISFPGALLQPHNYLSSIILLKVWMAVFYIASGVVIYLAVRHLYPHLAVFAAALYLWNPFVIMRVLGDGHNDVVMFFFVLLALYWAEKGDWAAVGPALMLSALIKYVTLVLGPVFLAYVLFMPAPERRQALPRLLLGGVIALALAIVIYLPFWDGLQTFHWTLSEGDKSITSTALLIQLYITQPLFHDLSGSLSRLLMRLVFLIPYGIVLLGVRPPIRRLHAASYQVMLLYILIAAAWFRPWYLLWVVTIGALLPSGWFLALTLTISFCGMFPDITEQYRIHVPWLTADLMRLYAAPIAVAFLAPAAVLIAGLIRFTSWDFSFAPGLSGSGAAPHRSPLPEGEREV